MDSESPAPDAASAALQALKTWQDQWAQALRALPPMPLPMPAMASMPAMPGASVGAMPALPQIRVPAEKLQALQQQYLQDAAALWTQGAQGGLQGDRRFAGEAWGQNPVASLCAATYLLNSRALQSLADAVEADDKTRARIRFAVEQASAALSPSNYMAFNAEAQARAIATRGESISQGVRNLLHDLQQGHVSQTDESRFEVGRNVATSEGAVVFENALFQLIEYKPLTPQVHQRPLLLVPPCINKYYILDLQPENSLIRYAVEQGHRTFVMSWRNPDASLAQVTWDDYVEDGVIRAIGVVREIAQTDTINTLGFCVGGTLLGTALAVLAARGEERAESVTLLTTFLDFSDTGVLDLFVDEAMVAYRESALAAGGLLKGQELASTFSFLRPNDLVWNYVVGNYLKGETPPPFDLLYWNSDSTNLPGPFYTWYLRNTYLENRLVQPGGVQVCGEAVDLRSIRAPAYIYGSREDHIVPIGAQGGGAYASTQIWSGPKRFVMGASGHIAGVINPPAKKKRSHWLREDGRFPPNQAEWAEGAAEHPGSWWTDWAAWLRPHAGKKVAAPKAYGRGKHRAIEPAPGRYVQQKA